MLCLMLVLCSGRPDRTRLLLYASSRRYRRCRFCASVLLALWLDIAQMFLQEESDLASAGGNLLGTEELGFHDTPEDPPEDLIQDSEFLKEGAQAQTGDISEKEAKISRDDDREARYARMGEGPADGQQGERAQQADRAEQSHAERRRMLLEQARLSVRGASASKYSAAAGESSSEGGWPRWLWKASREDVSEMTGFDSQQHKGSSSTEKKRQWKLASSASDLIGVVVGRSAKLLKIG